MDPETPNAVVSEQDQRLFADRSMLVGEDLLELASRYSNTDIMDRANAAIPAGSVTMNRWHLHRALEKAFEIRAIRTGRSVEWVKAEFAGIRKRKNIQSNLNTRRTSNKSIAIARTGDSTEEEPEEESLFANPKKLRGDTLISLAERYSNADITARITAAVRDKSEALKPHALYARLDRALKRRANRTGENIERLRDSLFEARKLHNVKQYNYRARGGSTVQTFEETTPAELTLQIAVAAETASLPTDEDGIGHTGDTTEEESDDDMTDAESPGILEGFTADEVEASNGLLSLSNDPEVIKASMILLSMLEKGFIDVPSEASEPATPVHGPMEETSR